MYKRQTQDPELRARFKGKPEHVINFFMFIAEEVRELLAQLGFRTLEEAVGHVECLDQNEAIKRWKSDGIDLSNVLMQPGPVPGTILHQTIEQNHELDKALDNKLIELCLLYTSNDRDTKDKIRAAQKTEG